MYILENSALPGSSKLSIPSVFKLIPKNILCSCKYFVILVGSGKNVLLNVKLKSLFWFLVLAYEPNKSIEIGISFVVKSFIKLGISSSL